MPWIPDSRYWIPVFVNETLSPDFKRYLDSRFHKQKYPGLRIPQAKIFRIPESLT